MLARACEQRGASAHLRERAAPERGLLELAVQRDKLELGVGGQLSRIHARSELGGEGWGLVAPAQHVAERRLVGLDREAAAPTRAAPRVAEERVGQGRRLHEQVALKEGDALLQAKGLGVSAGHSQA